MIYRSVLVATAALMLVACGSTGTEAEAPEATEADSVTTEAAPAAASDAASGPGEKPTREFVVGNWGNDGDCEMAVDLKADGTSDGPFGNWSYDDGEITFADAPEMKITVTVAEDGKNMDSVNAQGGKHQMTRCP